MNLLKIFCPVFALALILCAGCSTAKPEGAHVSVASPALQNWWNQPPPQYPDYKDDWGLAELIRDIVYLSK